MLPSLQVLADGQVHRTRQLNNQAADVLAISSEDRELLNRSGEPTYLNRANWALHYLVRAGAVMRPQRGRYTITETGRSLLSTNPDGLKEKDLRDIPAYVEYQETRRAASSDSPAVAVADETLSPTEQIEAGVARMNAEVATELLSQLHANEPEFFEEAVLKLIVAMGYGGTEGRATRTQLSNDGGIDGIVDQDALGLSRIYIQAKRYALDASVGRPEIQAFVGALHGNQANQGVFITTGRFTARAKTYADAISSRVVLVDGGRMANLMIRYRVGIQVKDTLKIVEVDQDFFE